MKKSELQKIDRLIQMSFLNALDIDSLSGSISFMHAPEKYPGGSWKMAMHSGIFELAEYYGEKVKIMAHPSSCFQYKAYFEHGGLEFEEFLTAHAAEQHKECFEEGAA